MSVLCKLCLVAIFVAGLGVLGLAIADEMALPWALASDIVPVIVDAPEMERMDAAHRFLETRIAPRILLFKLLGGLIVFLSLVCLLVGRAAGKAHQEN